MPIPKIVSLLRRHRSLSLEELGARLKLPTRVDVLREVLPLERAGLVTRLDCKGRVSQYVRLPSIRRPH